MEKWVTTKLHLYKICGGMFTKSHTVNKTTDQSSGILGNESSANI